MRVIANEFQIIQSDFEEDLDVARLQASVSSLLRRMVYYRNPEGIPKNADLPELKMVLGDIFPNTEKNDLIIDLVKKDRFVKSPHLDGAHLLQLVGEQLKRCRI